MDVFFSLFPTIFIIPISKLKLALLLTVQMESREEELSRHKPSIESLVINPAMSSSSDDTEVVFSEDYIDSPESCDIRSPLDVSGDGSGDCQSDELSSLGTVEADDDVINGTPQQTQPVLSLPIVPPSSVKEPGNLIILVEIIVNNIRFIVTHCYYHHLLLRCLF